MNNWISSLLTGENADTEEISLFLFLRHIESVQDLILTNIQSLRNNQLFPASTIEQIKILHHALWINKYNVNELEYKLIVTLMDKKYISLAELIIFMKENELATPLVAGWMHHFIRKLHKEGEFFIETKTHPSGAEYHWKPVRNEWNV